MHRRQITLGLLAAPLVLRAGPAQANLDRVRDKALGRLVLEYENSKVRVDKLTILNGSHTLGLSLRAKMPVYNEDRLEIDQSAISGLLRPTLQMRWDLSVRIGHVYLDNRSLVVQPLNDEILGVTKVTLAYRNRSYEPKGRLRSVSLNKIPVIGNLFKAGEARRDKNQLLIFLTPSIIRDDS